MPDPQHNLQAGDGSYPVDLADLKRVLDDAADNGPFQIVGCSLPPGPHAAYHVGRFPHELLQLLLFHLALQQQRGKAVARKVWGLRRQVKCLLRGIRWRDKRIHELYFGGVPGRQWRDEARESKRELQQLQQAFEIAIEQTEAARRLCKSYREEITQLRQEASDGS